MGKLKNLDLAAFAAMALALVLELAVYLATDQSLLAKLPPELGPVVLCLAAFARWRMAKPAEVALPESDVATEEATP